ncbi:MAG: ImmA/IrrE family metallo-endopeptidase [Actinobacteria bacterium]|nr:ImmA/IrrE family metallo-endopeptidase [Actinomycetota bacterium]
MIGGFEPTRLTVARKRRAMTKKDLAREADISVRILSDYERGVSDPSDATLKRLATALRYPIDFFTGPAVEELTTEVVSFRALTKLKAPQRDAALSAGTLAMSLYQWTAARFSLPDVDVPFLPDCDDPEIAAELVRREWNLGNKAVPNMVHLLESRGIRVFTLVEQCKEVDAFSCWFENEPFVFLNTQKSGERSRMDAAHELAHLVLHRQNQIPQGRDAEREAKAFASAFLMPRDDVMAVMNQFPDPSIEELLQLKARWKVSIAALVYRLNKLGLLSEWHHRNLWIELSSLDMRTKEPDEIPRETSLVLRKVFASLRDDGVKTSDVARQLRLPHDELTAFLVGLVMVPVAGSSSRTQARSGPPKLTLIES